MSEQPETFSLAEGWAAPIKVFVEHLQRILPEANLVAPTLTSIRYPKYRINGRWFKDTFEILISETQVDVSYYGVQHVRVTIAPHDPYAVRNLRESLQQHPGYVEAGVLLNVFASTFDASEMYVSTDPQHSPRKDDGNVYPMYIDPAQYLRTTTQIVTTDTTTPMITHKYTPSTSPIWMVGSDSYSTASATESASMTPTVGDYTKIQ